jgi:hypothetical protein
MRARDLRAQPGKLTAAQARGKNLNDSVAISVPSMRGAGASGSWRFAPAV